MKYLKHLTLVALCAAAPALAQPLGAGGDDYPVTTGGYRVIVPYPLAPHQQPVVDEELERARRHNQLLSQEFQRRILEQALERMERAR